ncbi:protein kinase [Pelomyxa schiedti]|nr:protein kinase [Pelomyxa schiedti]
MGNATSQDINHEGERHRDGDGVKQDYGKALALFKRAAAGGSGEALNNLALMYLNGQGVPSDPSRAAALFQGACDAGCLDAMYHLACRHAEAGAMAAAAALVWRASCCGAGPEAVRAHSRRVYDAVGGRDPGRCAELLRQVLDGGGGCAGETASLAACYLAALHLAGGGKGGVPRDGARAAALLQRAVDGGSAEAMNALGILYERGSRGYGIPPEIDRAVGLYQRAVDSGSTSALISLAWCYRDGLGVQRDVGKAVSLFQTAVDRGDLWALNGLGWCYTCGGEGVKRDYNTAASLFQRAADASCPGTGLGWCLQRGWGVERCTIKAASLYEKGVSAGEQGSVWGGGGERGGRGPLAKPGLAQDTAKALSLYNAAAENGESFAFAHLALNLLQEGGSREASAAVSLLRRGVDFGDPKAMFHLGMCFKDGVGVSQDKSEAFHLLQRAAGLGHKEPSKILATLPPPCLPPKPSKTAPKLTPCTSTQEVLQIQEQSIRTKTTSPAAPQLLSTRTPTPTTQNAETATKGADTTSSNPSKPSILATLAQDILSRAQEGDNDNDSANPQSQISNMEQVCLWLGSLGIDEESLNVIKNNKLVNYSVQQLCNLGMVGDAELGKLIVEEVQANLANQQEEEPPRQREFFGSTQPLAEMNYKCFAFVVGNGSYSQCPLTNTINDAQAIAQLLETRCKFEVTCHTNFPTLKEFIIALEEFKKKLKQAKKANNKVASIFYFAGHGRQLKGHNFLLMTSDESAFTEKNFEQLRIAAPMLGSVLDGIKNYSDLTIGIMDACRQSDRNDGPEEFRTRGFGPKGGEHLTKEDFPVGCIVVYPTGPGELTGDSCTIPHRKDHGFFTGCFLEAMDLARPGTPFTDIIDDIIVMVQGLSDGKQSPWLSKSVGTRFSLF